MIILIAPINRGVSNLDDARLLVLKRHHHVRASNATQALESTKGEVRFQVTDTRVVCF